MSYYALENIVDLNSIEFQIYDHNGLHYFQFQVYLNGKFFIKEYEIVGMLDELVDTKVKCGRDLYSELINSCLSAREVSDFYQELKCYGYDLLQDYGDFLVELTMEAKARVCAIHQDIILRYDDIYVYSKVDGCYSLVKQNVTYKELIELSGKEGDLFYSIMELLLIDFIDI